MTAGHSPGPWAVVVWIGAFVDVVDVDVILRFIYIFFTKPYTKVCIVGVSVLWIGMYPTEFPDCQANYRK